jgi:hypothetical protein
MRATVCTRLLMVLGNKVRKRRPVQRKICSGQGRRALLTQAYLRLINGSISWLISNFTGVPHDWQVVWCKPPFKLIASSLLGRRHLGQVIIRYPALSLGTKSGAMSLFSRSDLIGEAPKSLATSWKSSSIVYCPFCRKASANIPVGFLTWMYSPLQLLLRCAEIASVQSPEIRIPTSVAYSNRKRLNQARTC